MYVHSNPGGGLNVKELKCESRFFIPTYVHTHFNKGWVKVRVTESYDQLGLDVMDGFTQTNYQ